MLAIRLMQIFSNNKSNFKKVTELLGLYLQIRDDYCNLRSVEVSILFVSNESTVFTFLKQWFCFPLVHIE